MVYFVVNKHLCRNNNKCIKVLRAHKRELAGDKKNPVLNRYPCHLTSSLLASPFQISGASYCSVTMKAGYRLM